MAFSYDLASSNATTLNISKVRMQLGDTKPGAGVKPDGGNLDDAEIQALLSQEGNAVMPAVAAACEMLATIWATAADIQVGPRQESLSQVAARYEKRAATIRAQNTRSTVAAGTLTFDQDLYHFRYETK